MSIKDMNESAFVNITAQLINAFGSCETVSLIQPITDGKGAGINRECAKHIVLGSSNFAGCLCSPSVLD